MPFPGPWITPPTLDSGVDFTSQGLELTEFDSQASTDAGAYSGTGTLTQTQYAGSHDSIIVPTSFAGVGEVQVGLWLVEPAQFFLSDYNPPLPWPNGAVSVDYEPGDSTLLWPIRVQIATGSLIDLPDGDPGDLNALLKRLPAGSYIDSGGPYSAISLASWPTPATVSGWSTVATMTPAGVATPDHIDLAEADIDPTGGAAFWDGYDYYANNTHPVGRVFGGITLDVTFSYQPRRYRFLYDFRPPLAHRQRQDGVASAGPPLAHIGTAGSRPPLAWRQNNP